MRVLAFLITTLTLSFGGLGAEQVDAQAEKSSQKQPQENNDPSLAHFYKLALTLPEELAFFSHSMSVKADSDLAFPFMPEKLEPRLKERFVSSAYLDVQLLHLSYALPVQEFMKGFAVFDSKSKILAERGVTILASWDKRFGEAGKVYKLHQAFPGKVYRKLVSIFGTKHQTEILVAVYAERLESTFIPQLLQNIVELAAL